MRKKPSEFPGSVPAEARLDDDPVVGGEGGLGDLLQGRGRERAEEEPFVQAAQHGRHHLARHAHVADEGSHR